MAEFQEVIHQTKRICRSVNGNCGKCLMGAFSCPNNARFDSTEEQEFIDFANAVMDWAAEHPEPVYPTWGEWLTAMGILYHENNPRYFYSVSTKVQSSIPADIAEKLGIEPKEG